MSSLTLGDALELPGFRRTRPVVLAGREGLSRTIRWMHATELAEVKDLLRPGDLVLTMGTGLPADDDAPGFAAFAEEMAEVESAGLVLELGRRWREEVPRALIGAFDRVGVPLVALTHETQFAALTQTLGERIVDTQLAEMRDAQRVHDTFTELSFTKAGPAEILTAVQRLAGGPVVLENAQRRPLDYLAGSEDMAGFLDGWQRRSSRVDPAGRTGWDENNGWLVTRLGAGDQDWGRLIISAPTPPSQRLVAVAERAAAALALHRLHDRDRDNLMRRTHFELMEGLQSSPESDEVLRRCELAGFPTRQRQYLGMVVRSRPGAAIPVEPNDIAAAAVRAADGIKIAALVCEVDRDIRILVSLTLSANADSIADRLGERIGSHLDVVIAAGRSTSKRAGVDRSLREAEQVADAVPTGRAPDLREGSMSAPVHRLDDLHLRGLLSLFGDDDRLRAFVDRELAPLRAHDADPEARIDLLSALRALFRHPTSKTDAAASLHLSRSAFYDRLAKIESLLAVDLEDPDVRVSLHVAMLADDLSYPTAR